MNNIEILEERINFCKNNTECRELNQCFGCTFEIEEIQAIENLIQENKQLKEHLEKYYNGELFTAKQLKSIEENQKKYFVNKSKIKEKIEELEKDVNDFEEYWSKDPRKFKKEKSVDYYKLEALKELLEEGE